MALVTRTQSRRGQRQPPLPLLLLALVVGLPTSATAQIRSNLSSSVTSETMTHVWVARDRNGSRDSSEEFILSVAEGAQKDIYDTVSSSGRVRLGDRQP